MADKNEIVEPSPPLPQVEVPSILGIPLNRIITFVGPYISLLAGTIATAIISLLHVTIIAHDQLATGAANVLTFLLSSGLVWLGQQQWLKGHHIQLANLTPDVVLPMSEETVLAAEDTAALDDNDTDVVEAEADGFENEGDDPDGGEFVPSDHVPSDEEIEKGKQDVNDGTIDDLDRPLSTKTQHGGAGIEPGPIKGSPGEEPQV